VECKKEHRNKAADDDEMGNLDASLASWKKIYAPEA